MEIVTPSPWQEKSWQGRGKGEVFFCVLFFPARFFGGKSNTLRFWVGKRTVFLTWTLDMDFFSEAVVDDECMDFFRGWMCI